MSVGARSDALRNDRLVLRDVIGGDVPMNSTPAFSKALSLNSLSNFVRHGWTSSFISLKTVDRRQGALGHQWKSGRARGRFRPGGRA
jgi:hypothetical protein